MVIDGVSLKELADCLGLDYRPNGKMKCPFCGEGKLKLTFEKNIWNCLRCRTGGGVLALYAKYQLGYADLPSDKQELGELSQDMMRYCGREPVSREKAKTIRVRPPQQIASLIDPAPDEVLDRTYQAMAQIPMLQLTGYHRNLLRKRGLTDQDIDRNGYRSISGNHTVPEDILSLYESCGGERERERLQNATHGKFIPARKQILVGLYIAQYLQRQGFSLKGIPGFFLFGESGKEQSWCLYFPSGIMIPTRNIQGQIVLWQIRAENNPKRKYTTVSCSDLPGAVNHKVSRCHFPLGNASLEKGTRLIVTEGALKADVALSLSSDPAVAFVSILGVSTTADFFEKIPFIQSGGIRKIYDGFDMDRLTNPNVRRETGKLFAKLQEMDMDVQPLYWGEGCARRKLDYFRTVALYYGISYTVPIEASVYESLKIVAGAVLDYELDPQSHKTLNPLEYDPGGKKDKIHFYWDPETKGIDDYLFSLRHE